MFKSKKKSTTENHQTLWHQMNKKKPNKSKTNKARKERNTPGCKKKKKNYTKI